MTPHPIRAHVAHRSVRRSLSLVALSLATLASFPAHALTVLAGTYTLQHDETHSSVLIGPLGAVNTNGHTLTINGNGGLCCASLLLSGGHLYINSLQSGPGRVILSGAASHFIGANGSVELMDSSARLEIATVDPTVSGGGQIIGRHPDATISIASGKKLCSQLAIIGAMKIVGPGTFRNESLLSALGSYSTNAKITLAGDLNLEDDGTALWDASGAELEFNHAQLNETGLAGDISMRSFGKLDFRASVDCELFIWWCGTLSIAEGETITFWQFSAAAGGCFNPSESADPYSVTGPYDVDCTACSG